MPVYVVDTNPIPETPGAGRLGRHYRYDSRSARFARRRTGAAVTSKTWERHIAWLDQLNVGSCTGNAETGALGTTPVFEGLPANHPALDEKLALALYSAAEKIDGGAGYPPEDQGSSGSSVCQAAKNSGLISGYTWCNDLDDMLDALMAGPVIIGINWYSSFDTPDKNGLVSLPKSARIRGGHEVLIRQVDAESSLLWIDNSWGTSWGLQGRAAFPYSVITRLMSEQGDCAAPVAAAAPAPAPVPVPAPGPADTADQALAAAFAAWKTAKGI